MDELNEQNKIGALRGSIVRVSLTGAEDSVDPAALMDISASHPQAEWALLYLPEREGQGRNPSQAWREKFLDVAEGSAWTALHLCGEAAFKRLLDDGPWQELSRYGRIQANLNARSSVFDKRDALRIWSMLASLTGGLVIQMHEQVEPWAMEFLATKTLDMKAEVLFDESKGRGVAPSAWRPCLEGVACGYAGGLGPDNVAMAMPAIQAAAAGAGCWIDMESAIRTGDRFDLTKCLAVLQASEPWIEPAARARGPRPAF